jgi:hypothetical protein
MNKLVLGWTAAAALLLAAGCNKKAAEKPEPKLTAEEKAKGQKMWAELLGVKTKAGSKGGKGLGGMLSPPATSLRAAFEGFKSYETCLASLERQLPADLGIDLLSYHNIPDALCRTREAISRKNVNTCNQVQSYTMKKGCQIMYATYHRSPDDCKMGHRGRQGRDGYCLALATRNPSLCEAARNKGEAARCKAILEQSPAVCERVTQRGKRLSCKAEVKRWKGEIQAGQATLPTGFAPKLELDLKMEPGGRALPYRYQRVEPNCVYVGAVAPTVGDAEHVNVCDYYTYGFYRRGSHSSGVYRHAKIDFSFKPPSSPTEVLKFGTDAKFAIKISGFGEFGANPVGELKFSAFERKRGGRVAATFKVTVTGAGDRLTVTGKLDSFVRDLVTPAQMQKGTRRGTRYPSRYGSGKYGSRRLGGLLGSKRVGSGRLGTRHTPRPTKRFAALLTAASITKVTIGGKAGFQVASILPNSVWDRLGVRNGDVLHVVGRTKLNTKSDVVRVRTELRDAKALTIRLQRNKRNKTLRVNKVTLDGLRRDFYF